ncbi:MAG: glycosyltransferase family 4 protein [Armatimonadetes bacterium]|nr:glycosyltransferase family 4 protein [Armatimonadota bacterium]
MLMETMRILEVITPSKLSGAEIYASDLSRGLMERGSRVVVLTKNVPLVVEKMRRSGLDVRTGGIGGKLNIISVLRLLRLVRKERIDIINSHLSTAGLISSVAGRLAGVPVVATVHALNTATCFRLAHRVIAVSNAVKKHVVGQGIPAERISVIYPGVDMAAFSRNGNADSIRRELGIPPGAPVVGMVAHLTRKKGHHVLLPAVEKVLSSRPECRFLIVGTGPLDFALRVTTKRKGLGENVVFTGFRKDIRDVIESMDVVVLPSISGEGLPVSLIQAMSLSKPVVGSRLSGIPEIVEEDKTGLLVTPGDHNELAQAIMRLVGDDNLRNQMGSAARERAQRLFSLQNCVDHTWRLYTQVIENKERC